MTDELVAQVWIEEGCILCDECTSNCPEVFEIRQENCFIRAQARMADFVRPLSELIIETAAECPVGVIKYATARRGVNEDSQGRAEPESEISRRSIISAAGVGWLALGGSAVVGGLALQRFMMPNVLQESDPRVEVGRISDYAEMASGSVNQAYKKYGMYIARLQERLVALSSACTHLGCITNWLQSEGVFKCPCHGSGFTHAGINIDGPAPRPLERFWIFVEDGTIIVDRSKRYRQEKGGWANPDSYIKI